MKKRALTLLALLFIVPAMLFATDVVITWEWMLDDPQVTGFRYQLDDENPDDWVVVSADETTATFQHLDGSKEYSLYLQQTYDGVNWSASAVSIAYPLFEDESVKTIEEPMEEPKEEMVEEVVADSEVVKAEVKEEVVAESEEMMDMGEVVNEESKDSRYYSSVSLNMGGQYSLATLAKDSSGSYNNIAPVVGLSLGLNNLMSLSDTVGLGLNIDLDYVGYVNGSFKEALFSFFTSNTDFSLCLALVPEMEFDFGNVVVDLGAIVDATFVNAPYIGNADLTPDFLNKVVLGYGGKIGLAYRATNWLQLGLEGNIHKVGGYNLSSGSWVAGGKALLKLTF